MSLCRKVSESSAPHVELSLVGVGVLDRVRPDPACQRRV